MGLSKDDIQALKDKFIAIHGGDKVGIFDLFISAIQSFYECADALDESEAQRLELERKLKTAKTMLHDLLKNKDQTKIPWAKYNRWLEELEAPVEKL